MLSRAKQKCFRKICNNSEAYRIGVAYRFAKQNNEILATAAAPNAKELLKFEENIFVLVLRDGLLPASLAVAITKTSLATQHKAAGKTVQALYLYLLYLLKPFLLLALLCCKQVFRL